MTLSRRVSLIVAGAVALAVVLTVAASYLAVTRELMSQTDRQLRAQAEALSTLLAQDRPRAAIVLSGTTPPGQSGANGPLSRLQPRTAGPFGTMQFIPSSGGPVRLVAESSDAKAPIDARDRAIARGRAPALLRTVHAPSGERIRIITEPLGSFGAMQIGQPLGGIDAVRNRLVLILLAIGAAGVALGLLASRVLTRRATAPVRELADTTRRVTETGDLTLRIPDTSDDELGQLAHQINAMLDALQRSRSELAGSVAAQRQLIADASHELRTPITSLRTNLELLAEEVVQLPEQQQQLLAVLVEEVSGLGDLVGDVIELARGDAAPPTLEPVELPAIVAACIQRAQRHYPTVLFTSSADHAAFDGAPDRLARAVSNLLDNAAKHAGVDGRVDVMVDATGITVTDDGPGIPVADLPHVFDRFYRGADERSVQGTGLGLAIVRQVAELHGGRATATNLDRGGARFRIELPPALEPCTNG